MQSWLANRNCSQNGVCWAYYFNLVPCKPSIELTEKGPYIAPKGLNLTWNFSLYAYFPCWTFLMLTFIKLCRSVIRLNLTRKFCVYSYVELFCLRSKKKNRSVSSCTISGWNLSLTYTKSYDSSTNF